jgi:hypothetical protein
MQWLGRGEGNVFYICRIKLSGLRRKSGYHKGKGKGKGHEHQLLTGYLHLLQCDNAPPSFSVGRLVSSP